LASLEILWTGPALSDLREIRTFITADGRPLAAKRWAQGIRTRVEALVEHPKSGRRVPEFPTARYREIIVPPFRIVYQLEDLQILILRVWHSHRGIPTLPPKR